MDISYIREFVMLAECGSFSEAAARLFVAQSSLSKHIQAMEKELGAPLFNRTTRSLRLSEAGALYLPYAKKLAALSVESQIALDDFKRRAATSLTIAVMQNPQYYGMARYITGFRQAYPELAFSMVEADEQALYEMFRKKTVNVFPAYSNFAGAGDYTFMPMVDSYMVALMRRDHPSARRGSVSLRQLGGERLLLPTRGGSPVHADAGGVPAGGRGAAGGVRGQFCGLHRPGEGGDGGVPPRAGVRRRLWGGRGRVLRGTGAGHHLLLRPGLPAAGGVDPRGAAVSVLYDAVRAEMK